MKIFILSIILTSCGLPVAENGTALLRAPKELATIRQPTITELLRQFFADPKVIVKLENGQGVTSKFIAEALGVKVPQISSQIGSLKGELVIERVIRREEGDSIWIRRGVEPIIINKTKDTYYKLFEEFFSRPDIARRLTNGTGLLPREIRKALNLRSSRAVTKYLLEFKDQLSIKPIERSQIYSHGWLWIHKDANYVDLPPSLNRIFPSGLTLQEFFAQPSVIRRMTDGRGLSSGKITKMLGLDPQEKQSLGQMLRHSGKHLGIKNYRRLGDQKLLWMRYGIEPIPNYKRIYKNK